MTDNVVKLKPEMKTPDELLDELKDTFTDFIILGYNKDEMFTAALTKGFADGGDILWMFEQFKFNLMVGTYADAEG
jgi:hypothetical protein